MRKESSKTLNWYICEMSFELEFNELMPSHLCLLYTVDQKY